MITLQPTTESIEKFRQVFAGIIDVAGSESLSFAMFETGFDAWADRVFEIFQDEGQPGWASLKESTMNEREKHGYSRAHPILRRSKTLRESLTERDSHVRYEKLPNANPDEPVLVGNITDLLRTSAGTTWRFATLDERFLSLHEAVGEPWPPRPMVPVGGQRDEVGREIERQLVKMLRKALPNV